MTAKTNILDEPNKAFDGVALDVEWRAPAGMGFHPFWLAHLSWGCGTHACHVGAGLLGLAITFRIYWRTDNVR